MFAVRPRVISGVAASAAPAAATDAPSAGPSASAAHGEREPLRQYQEYFCRLAREHNVIAVLPTGAGKTRIAVEMVGEALERFPDRAVVFVAPTVALVEQQYAVLDKAFPGRCRRCGAGRPLSLDSGDPCRNVFVTTPQTFVNVLFANRAKQNTDRVWSLLSLLVLDEAHHCSKRHPYEALMQYYRDCKGPKPRVLGLTASPAAGMHVDARVLERLCFSTQSALACLPPELAEAAADDASDAEDDVVLVESASAASASPTAAAPTEKLAPDVGRLAKELQAAVNIPTIERIRPTDEEREHAEQLAEISGRLFELWQGLWWQMTQSQHVQECPTMQVELADVPTGEGTPGAPAPDVFPQLLVYLQDRWAELSKREYICEHCLHLMGAVVDVLGAHIALDECGPAVAVNMLDSLVDTLQQHEPLAQCSTAELRTAKGLRGELQRCAEDPACLPVPLACLRRLLLEAAQPRRASAADGDDPPDFCGIVFVNSRLSARAVASWLTSDAALKPLVRPAFFLGQATRKSYERTEERCSRADLERILKEFQSGTVNVLVATTVAEEGIDVPRCRLVCRLSAQQTPIQMIQSRGRARFRDSRYVIVSANEKDEEYIQAAVRAEEEMHRLLSASPLMYKQHCCTTMWENKPTEPGPYRSPSVAAAAAAGRAAGRLRLVGLRRGASPVSSIARAPDVSGHWLAARLYLQQEYLTWVQAACCDPLNDAWSAKSALNEIYQQKFRVSIPLNYEVERRGPPHCPSFRATVMLPDGRQATGLWTSKKKDAEKLAAGAVLARVLKDPEDERAGERHVPDQ